MKKFIKKLFIGFAIFIGLSAMVLYFTFAWILNAGVKAAVEKGLPPITQTTVTLTEVKLSPFSGSGIINGLVVGNPTGYKTDRLFKIDSLNLAIDLGSMGKDIFVVKEIAVRGAEITYEVDLKRRKSNLTALQDNIEQSLKVLDSPEGETAPEAKPEKPKTEEAEDTERKVIIDRFVMEECTVRLSATLTKGKTATLKLPKIELTNIGRKAGGQTIREASAQIMRQLGSTVRGAIANNQEFIKALGDKLPDAVRNIGDQTIGRALDKLEEKIPISGKLREQIEGKAGAEIKRGIKKLFNK